MRVFSPAVLFALVFASAMSASAQSSFGLRGGINAATLAGHDAEGMGGRTGVHVGMFANFPLGSRFSLQPELLVVQKGATFDGDLGEFERDGEGVDLPREGRATYALTYIDVPVLLKYAVHIDGPLEVHMFAGPQISSKRRERVQFLGTSYPVSLAERRDVGVVFGGELGTRLRGGFSRIGVDVRYSIGLNELGEEFAGRNRVLSISAFYGL